MSFRLSSEIQSSVFVYFNFFEAVLKCKYCDKFNGVTRKQICFLLLLYHFIDDNNEVVLSKMKQYKFCQQHRRYYVCCCSRWICKVRRDHYRFTDAGIELIEYFVREYEKRASKTFSWS